MIVADATAAAAATTGVGGCFTEKACHTFADCDKMQRRYVEIKWNEDNFSIVRQNSNTEIIIEARSK